MINQPTAQDALKRPETLLGDTEVRLAIFL